MTNPILSVKNLSKKYRKKIIFQNLNLDIFPNTITTIYGESGSGKSTLIHIMGLLEKPSKGKIYFKEQQAPRPNTFRARKILKNEISFLFQNFALINDKSVNYNLNLAYNHKINHQEFEQEKARLLQQFLPQVSLKQKVAILSGGEQQRLALIRALLKPGEIIFGDEPTGSVDPKNREKIFKIFQYAKENGKTVILVSHDPYIINKSDYKYQLQDLTSQI
ncbi:ATP-binding cassette domain-containing protein [Lactobacillus sp. PV037]|uniref:ATP-binding cassette domain-containing protein n=1 Tax=Lactobacillus sp. PV037 TaxID=2594496 RepID=UPI00223F9833|nr:ATP-binding cassette domain-containing protein [Lactobacillus sp. PV037]QNQ84375.1 ATP-binding cassette domain-containing protein [Lactobacillus sp. PV037]